jgi:hypothetical protein
MERWIAARVMKLATSNLPNGREVWGHAMNAEFEAIQVRSLSWALGCLAASIGWRLRRDWLFFAAVASAIVFLDYLMFLLDAYVLTWPRGAPQDLLGRTVLYGYGLAYPAVACAALAAWRPGYAFMTACAIAVGREAIGAYALGVVMHAPLDRHWVIMDGPPIVGYSAVLGWCVLGAAIGRRLRLRGKPIAG